MERAVDEKVGGEENKRKERGRGVKKSARDGEKQNTEVWKNR